MLNSAMTALTRNQWTASFSSSTPPRIFDPTRSVRQNNNRVTGRSVLQKPHAYTLFVCSLRTRQCLRVRVHDGATSLVHGLATGKVRLISILSRYGTREHHSTPEHTCITHRLNAIAQPYQLPEFKHFLQTIPSFCVTRTLANHRNSAHRNSS